MDRTYNLWGKTVVRILIPPIPGPYAEFNVGRFFSRKSGPF